MFKLLFYLLLLLSLLTSVACTKYSPVVMENNRTFIQPIAWGIESVEKIDWKVGPMFQDNVSKGVFFEVKLPIIENDKLAELMHKKDVDGWLLKILRHSTNTAETIGHLYIHFPDNNEDARGRRGGGRNQIELATFQINYFASAFSQNFLNVKCPAFGHRKYIKSMDLDDDSNNSMKLLNISAIEEETIPVNVEPFSFLTTVFNGGMTLLGTYEVQIALFNSKSKLRKSNFIAAPKMLQVSLEEERFIPGCVIGNDTPSMRQEETPPKKAFKFGKQNQED